VIPDRANEVGWQRLHPLSPVARIGRIVPILAVGVVASLTNRSSGGGETTYVAITSGLLVILGVIHWLVTRWKIDGDTLRIETGLIRRDSRQLPLSRIQAVDVVRPLLARLLGMSELRIRLAGSGSTDGRLAFLSEQGALELRRRLLAPRGIVDTPAVSVAEHPLAEVGTGRLAASVLLSGVGVVLFLFVITLIVLAGVAPKAAAVTVGFLAIYLIGIAQGLWRRLSSEFHFEAIDAPEGIRIRRGLLETVSETVPYARIQAIRQLESPLWRPFGWARLEVYIAGAVARSQNGEGSGVARKALLPVGTGREAQTMVDHLLGAPRPTMTPPPPLARGKAPLSYHFLSIGLTDDFAVCVTGRVRKQTTWVPLEKVQSIRRVQGPLQRRLGLASVIVDVAGRRVRGLCRDRSVEEADLLIEQLTDLTRLARQRHRALGPARHPAPPVDIPAAWYPDPSGRHELRYWRDGVWTEHVSSAGVATVDPTPRPD
jgi:putative membrane protein